MRLRYLHLEKYPPIQDLAVRFASGSPLERDCAIRFVVGVNGSGKSNLLRAVAEVFLALADMRLPPFPVTLVYELGKQGSQSGRTLLLDCPGRRDESSLWLNEHYRFADTNGPEVFEFAIVHLRAKGIPSAPGFLPLIKPGDWPTRAVNPPQIALPNAVLAYTTGNPRPWQAVWDRNQDADGVMTSSSEEGEDSDEERPPGWTATLEAAQAASQKSDAGSLALNGLDPGIPSGSDIFRRPILLTPTLLKFALLAVALPQSFIETHDYPGRAEVDAAMAKLRRRSDNKSPLQELLERGGWRHLVSVGFQCILQPRTWRSEILDTAHDWLLCASEVISEPHPTEARRVLYFDLKESFSAQGIATLIAYDGLDASATHGEALWALLGGRKVPPFEYFSKLLVLHQAGFFEDVQLRLRRADKPDANTNPEVRDQDVGVLRYEELSDGEQMVLGRMALFHLLAEQEDALLLLDEPETHFNDKWKREIVDIIDDAIGHTANDVLISTHSAIVLSDVFNDEIVLVEKTAEGTGARPVYQQTFATDPSALMMSVFEAEDSIGKRAQEFIEAKLRQATGSDADILQLEQLIARMGSGFYRSELRTLLNTWRRARPDEP